MKEHNITAGDLITAYHAGYHIVTRIEFRGETNDLIHYQTVANGVGKEVKSKTEKRCDVAYCTKLDRESVLKLYEEEIQEALTKRDALLKFV